MKFILIFFLSLVSVSYAQVEGDVSFYFIGTNITDYYNLTSAAQFTSNVFNTRFFNPNKNTVIYTHGYLNSFASEGDQTVAKAYLSRGDHNIILVDWSKYTFNLYTNTVADMPGVANLIAGMLDTMQTQGLNLRKVHLVGHSLGAQMSGMIGTIFKTTKAFSFCRITGLDPAGPLFWNDNTKITSLPLGVMPELGVNDAIFVDIIHTDADLWGYNMFKKAQGHADFWVSGGKTQKGCQFACLTGDPECISCSHNRVWEYYAESVARKTVPPFPFMAKMCPVGVTSYNEWFCTGTTVSMGYHLVDGGSIGGCTPISFASPNFWLTTKSSSPYSLT